MVAVTSVSTQARENHIPIETMRCVAVVLLVAYHVVGSGKGAGLDVGYPHGLRLFADFFSDIRMPLFAFVAGYVYTLRPLTMDNYGAFIGGKTRRLVVPGVVAIVAFVLVSNKMGTRFALPLDELWRPFLQGYAHYWFLQSIVLIFAVFGLVDALLRGAYSILILIGAVFVYLAGWRLELSVFSASGVIYLLPYFMLGVVFYRYASEITEEAERITLVLLLVLVIGGIWNVQVLIESGAFSADLRDIHSLAFGMAFCALAILWCPRLSLLEKLSPYAFTIYLYHVFGTSGARNAMDAAGVASIETRFVISLMCGIALPVLLHETLRRVPRIASVTLGR